MFEGRDGAGKGGTIKAITERVSPRVFRVVALPAPTEREKSQMYMQRYLPHLPAAGEVVIFDRSWYNRAGVERVMGFCTEEQVRALPRRSRRSSRRRWSSPASSCIKYWLEVSEEEQTRRLEARIDDGRKIWKLSPMDLKSYSRWYDYSRARDEMFAATDTDWAPWYVARSDDKRRGRLNIITHLLEPDSLQEGAAREDQAAEAAEARRATASRTTRTSSSRSASESQAGSVAAPEEPDGSRPEALAARGCRRWAVQGLLASPRFDGRPGADHDAGPGRDRLCGGFGLPGIHGLYATIVPLLAYALFGPEPHSRAGARSPRSPR